MRKGVYKEKLIVSESKINISLIGQEGAVISYDDYANKQNVFGENKGTSGSSSCYIYAPDFYVENITFENTSGPVGPVSYTHLDVYKRQRLWYGKEGGTSMTELGTDLFLKGGDCKHPQYSRCV